MFSAFISMFKITDLRKKVLVTLFLLAMCRIGAQVPTPGVNQKALVQAIESRRGGAPATLFGLINLFSGGAFSRATVLALGIMPYISASIIMQLLTAVIPSLEKLYKEGGEEGRRKMTQYTRYATVGLCMFQGFFMATFVESLSAQFPGAGIVARPGLGFRLMTMVTMTTGTMVLMWIGERISEWGVGNGISLIITVGIVSRAPFAFTTIWGNLSLKDPSAQQLRPSWLPVLILLFVVVTAGVIMLTQGQRRIPVQYAKRIVGRRVYTGQSSYIPLRVNYAGVIPIIFASAILMFPATIGTWTRVPFIRRLAALLYPDRLTNVVLEILLIIFFCYFWTATQFDPIQIANNMKRNGAFVPGIRPGKPTAAFFEKNMTRITFAGAVFLAFIAVIPRLLIRSIPGIDWNVASFFGGTALLIIVGVTLDTMQAIESHLLMRHYDGFMRKGKLRGRY